jgi:hypothetical protein
MQPLPPEPFELATWSTPKVAPDCHVKVGTALYSVAWRHIGVRVDARLTERTVEIYRDGQLIKTHPRAARGRRTDYDDYPPEKVAFFMRTPTWCRHRAIELGHSVAAVVDELLAGGALHHLRAAQGVIGLAERHDAARVDVACRRALQAGDPSYRTVKGILALHSDTDDDTTDAGVTAPAHLHGPDTLFDGSPSLRR